MTKFQYFFFIFILLVLPSFINGECTCDSDKLQDRNKTGALKYKYAAIAAILIAGAIGIFLPLLGRIIPALHPEKDIFFVIKSFAAGVILSTSFVHILPDAFENLSSPCLHENPWQNFPFTGFIAMLSAIITLMIESYVTAYFNKSSDMGKTFSSMNLASADVEKISTDMDVHTHATHGHSHGTVSVGNSNHSDVLRRRVVSQVLELGIIVHSVIIGVSLGASENAKTVKSLIAALTFHQFFEGMGLGGCIGQANFKTRKIIIMTLFFCLTTPVGIIIGMGISNVYDENSPTALIVEGIFNAASAGILLYMGLVDLLAADFMNTRLQANFKLQFGASISLLLGAGCMSLLAKWA